MSDLAVGLPVRDLLQVSRLVVHQVFSVHLTVWAFGLAPLNLTIVTSRTGHFSFGFI